MSLRGRPPFIVTPLSAFTTGVPGEAPLEPFDQEFVVMDSGEFEGHIGRIVEDVTAPAGWRFESKSMELAKTIRDLKVTGVIDNAAAGVLSKELTYFVFNISGNNNTVRLNPSLIFNSQVKFYAIRSGNDYITGISTNGKVLTNLVGMTTRTVNLIGGITNEVSIPDFGKILPGKTFVHGEPYTVEFYDAAQTLISRDSYFAENAKLMTSANTGAAVAITSIVAIPNRIYDQADISKTYIYLHENIQQVISFDVRINYNDGSTRSVVVNNIGSNVDNINVAGAEGIENSVLTGSSTPKELTISATDPVSGLKVYTNVKVYVVADSLLSVLKMLPIYFNDGTAIGGSNVQNVSSHFLVLTGTGAVADVTDSYTVNPTKLVQDQRPISLTTGPIDAPGGISR